MLMRRVWPLLPVLIAAVLGLSGHAFAQDRVALVIGNSSYAKVPSLPNPAHDAQDVSEALQRLGFTVKTITDADFDRLRRSLVEFGRAASNADMAVLYFAGHGIEIDGNNWLLPTDVELRYDVDASTEAIGLPSAIQAVSAAKTLGLVILDACRNNPFKSSMRKSVPSHGAQILGLAPVEPASNVLVAYAARDGTVANDGTGRNSPYTAALLKHIETPGMEIDFLFRNVRDDVMAATNYEQQPFVYGSLSSDEIYFKGPPAGEAAADEPAPPDAAEITWSFLRATNDVSTLARFVDRFPESAHVSDARGRIASLATAASMRGAGDVVLPPLGRPVAFADTELEQTEKAVARRFTRDTPAINVAWDIVKDTRDHTMIRRFVDRFPGQKRQVEADTRLAALGQKPITVHVARQSLDVDETILAHAAADPDVHQCFQDGDQTTAGCRKAFERFPDISRFVEDSRFTIGFCQGMGSPGGCVPTVKTAWNFPGSNPGGGGASGPGKTGGGNPSDGGTGSHGGGAAGTGTPVGGNENALPGKDLKGPKDLVKLHGHGSTHSSTGGKDASLKTTSLKTTSLKATGFRTTGVKLTGVNAVNTKVPTVPGPVVRTPNVRVTPRIPNIPIQVHVR